MPPSRNDIRNDTRPTTPCPVCQTPFTPVGRQRYCTPACRQAAWRARHPQPAPQPADSITPGPPRRATTVYQCPVCDTRYLGQQWCSDCHHPCTRLGPGARCPHCDEPITINDILDEAQPPHPRP